MAAKNAISSMYVTSAILKGRKADATKIFMKKKKGEYFSTCQKCSYIGHCLLEWHSSWSFEDKIKVGVNFSSKISSTTFLFDFH